MALFDLLAERKISEALARGEFAGLPGEGRPLDLEADLLVPEEMRVVCRMLKNAGFLPPQVEQIREIAELERLVLRDGEAGDTARARAAGRLALLKAKIEAGYYERVVAKVSRY